MNKNENNKKALHFLTLSFSYLSLVENVLNETINFGNEHLILSDHELLLGEYEGRTKWSDFNIIVPTLYNFYHGLELLMKGLVILLGKEVDPKHNIGQLFSEIKSNGKVDIKNYY